MRRSTQLCLIFGALLVGVALGRAGWLPSSLLAVGVMALVAALAGRSRLFGLCLSLLTLAIGLWCAGLWLDRRAQLTGLIGHQVTLTGVISDDPGRTPTGQLNFALGNLSSGGRAVPGKISVHIYALQLQRGYRVQVTGRVKAGFGNATAELSYPQLQVLSRDQGWLERFRQHFFAGMRAALPEPLASFGLGLLVGIRALIPRPMQDQLALVGLSHLVAVSGYNLTIIVSAADRLLQKAGRGVSLLTSFWLIGSFLLITGAGASIVRAALVSGLSLLAGYYGRRFNPLVLILASAGLTAAVNPSYLTDLGWLLSFLAFYGILVVAPVVEARLHHPRSVVVRLFIESTAAQLTTLPLILWMFGDLSLVAPLSNLLILPLIPIAMAVSFVAGLGGMLLPAFAGWLAWPAMLVLWLITTLIDQFAALPWAGRNEHLSLVAMLAMYALIIGLAALMARLNRRAGRRPAPDRLLELAKS